MSPKRTYQNLQRGARLFTLANSPLFLWVLSSVVLGGLSFVYSRWDKAKQEGLVRLRIEEQARRDTEASIAKLDAEIASRLEYVATVMQVHESVPQYALVPSQGLTETMRTLDIPLDAKHVVSVFSEYSKRTLRSLLWELKALVPDSQKPEIEGAYQATHMLLLFQVIEGEVRTQEPLTEEEMGRIDTDPTVTDRLRALHVKVSSKSIALSLFKLNMNLPRWGRPLTESARQLVTIKTSSVDEQAPTASPATIDFSP